MKQPLEPKHAADESLFEETKSSSPLQVEDETLRVEALEEKPEEVITTEVTDNPEPEVANNLKDETVPEEKPEEDVFIPEISNEDDSEDSEEDRTENLFSEQTDKLSKEQIIERLEVLVEIPIDENVKAEVDALKQSFYKQKRTEIEEAKKAFLAEGKDENEFAAPVDELEEKMKDKLQGFREKKASLTAEKEKVKEENLQAKKAIIEELKTLIESQDDFYKVYNEFRKLQQRWKEIKQVPQASINDLWKAYQHYSEIFYDLLKINNEMRDYDFKKNLELKSTLCEAAERLDSEKDIISAFYQLQKLHQEWREIGPVSKEMREDIWARFKKASTVINKKHQEHFEDLRSLEQRNLEEKTAICEEMETIDYSKLTSFKDWDEMNKRVLELQEKWKTIGFAPKKHNVKIFERFRGDCDLFFQKKSEFYKGIKETMDANYEKKKVLCEKAESMKDSQDWKEATDKFIALQKEWKTIGPVSRKHSDAIWKRFISACDYFFEQKNTHFASQKSEEVENLKLKKELIEQLNAIDESLNSSEAIAKVRAIMNEWNNIGFVPFREKDKIYKEYREAVDKQFERLKIDESEKRLQSFKSNVTDIASGGDKSKNKLLNEREKLMRTYERLKNDIQTYENNIGFLSVSSKGGGGLLKDMNHKIDSLKEELKLIIKKVEVIDESLGFEK